MRNFIENAYEDLYEFLLQRKYDDFECYPDIDRQNGKTHPEYSINTDNFVAIVLKSDNKVIGNICFSPKDFRIFKKSDLYSKYLVKKG